MQKRVKKQIIYGLIFLIIFAGIGSLIYLFIPKEPPLPPPAIIQPKDIEIIWAKSAQQVLGLCDLAARIKNPNPNHFSYQLNYEFLLYEQQGPNSIVVSQKAGTTWILPYQEKYIIENQVSCPINISRVIFKLAEKIDWQKFEEYREPQIEIFQKEYQKLQQGPPYGQVSAVVANKNEFPLENIFINIILEDNNNNLLSSRQGKIDYLLSSQEQKITHQWLTEINQDVFRLIIEPDIQISSIFLK